MIYILKLEKDKWYVGYTDRKDGERFTEHFTGQGSEWTKKYKPITVAEWIDGDLEDENKVTLELMKTYGWWNVRGGKWCKTEMSCPPTELDIIDPKTKTILKSAIANAINGKFKKPQLQVVDSTDKYIIQSKMNELGGCYRCGRPGHIASNCYAQSTVDGYIVSDYDSDYSDDSDDSDDSDEEDQDYEMEYSCSYCNKEFETRKGAAYHENVYCKKKYNGTTQYKILGYAKQNGLSKDKSKSTNNKCNRCGRAGHYYNDCYASIHVKGYSL